MIEKIKELMAGRVGEAIRYVFFGGLTTLVSIGLFAVFSDVLHIGNTVSNVLSIICAILFAYVVNKLFVFRTKGLSRRELFLEFVKFVGGRLITMGLEVGAFELLVTGLGLYKYIGKPLSQILAITGNYFISRFLVFRKTNEGSK